MTTLGIFVDGWSVYLFQVTSERSSFNAVLTIFVRLVPVKLRIAFYALPYCSKIENLKINITWIFPWDDKFSLFRIIVRQINQLLKIFTSTYGFIDIVEPTKDWLKYNGDLNNTLFWTDHLYLSKFGNKKLASSIFTLLQQYKIVPTYLILVPVSSVVCKSFILSQCVCEVDPPCYVTVDVSTVKNGKYSPSCYNVTSVNHIKVCNFFVSYQMVCEGLSNLCWCWSCDH